VNELPANVGDEHGDVGRLASRRPALTERSVDHSAVRLVVPEWITGIFQSMTWTWSCVQFSCLRCLSCVVPHVYRGQLVDVIGAGKYVEHAVVMIGIVALQLTMNWLLSGVDGNELRILLDKNRQIYRKVETSTSQHWPDATVDLRSRRIKVPGPFW